MGDMVEGQLGNEMDAGGDDVEQFVCAQVIIVILIVILIIIIVIVTIVFIYILTTKPSLFQLCGTGFTITSSVVHSVHCTAQCTPLI